MTEHGTADDSTVLDVPWAAVFDPAANIRALGAVQSQGLRAASALVDRFVTSMTDPVARDHSSSGHENGTPTDESGDRTGRADSLLEGWRTLISRVLPEVSGAAGPIDGVAALDVVSGAASRSVHLTGSGGGSACAEVWLHNGGGDDLGEIRLLAGDLLSHSGQTLASDRVAFDPAVLALPPRTSRGAVVTVEVDADAAAGVYRGTLLVEGRPELWLPLVLTVTAPGG